MAETPRTVTIDISTQPDVARLLDELKELRAFATEVRAALSRAGRAGLWPPDAIDSLATQATRSER